MGYQAFNFLHYFTAHRHDVGDDGTDKHSPTRQEKSGRVSKMVL